MARPVKNKAEKRDQWIRIRCAKSDRLLLANLRIRLGWKAAKVSEADIVLAALEMFAKKNGVAIDRPSPLMKKQKYRQLRVDDPPRPLVFPDIP